MTLKRKLVHTDTPEAKPGFLGRGHLARPVIQRPFAESDPFIMLMDDRLDKKDDAPAGGPHPHASFETVSLLIEGDMGEMKAGDFQMMTAGAGVIHTETIEKPTKMRLLQLWLNLPKSDRGRYPDCRSLQRRRRLLFRKMASAFGYTVAAWRGLLLRLKIIHPSSWRI